MMTATPPVKVLDLSRPEDARWYIANFEWLGLPSKPAYIEFTGGRRIFFKNMTDQEAQDAAHAIYRDIACAIESRRARKNGCVQ